MNIDLNPSAIGKRRRRNPEFVDDFVARPSFLYGSQSALKQSEALFRSSYGLPFEKNPSEAIGIRVGSQNRQLLLSGGQLCVTLTQKFLCLNDRPLDTRKQLEFANAMLSRRHFFDFPSCMATLTGEDSRCNSCQVSFHPTAPLLAIGSGHYYSPAKLWRFSPDGSMVTCVATLVMPQVTAFPRSRIHRLERQHTVWSVAFHPTAPLLATGDGDSTAKLWRFSTDGSTVTCVATLSGHSESVFSVAFHPTAFILATGSGDNTAKLWRFSPDGSTATCVANLSKHKGGVHSVAFHPTALLLATGSGDKTAKLWRFSRNGLKMTCVATLLGHSDLVYSVAFHPTALLLATGSDDDTAKIWRISSDGSMAHCVATLLGHGSDRSVGIGVSSVSFHPTAPLLATGSGDKTAKVWRFSHDGSNVTCVATLSGHSDCVLSVAFHPTAPLMATGSSDSTVKLWS
jgi:WD40 repeat protein